MREQGIDISPSFPLTIEAKEFEYFQAYWNEDVVNLVVNDTNSYYKHCVEQNTVHEVAKKVPYKCCRAIFLFLLLS